MVEMLCGFWMLSTSLRVLYTAEGMDEFIQTPLLGFSISEMVLPVSFLGSGEAGLTANLLCAGG